MSEENIEENVEYWDCSEDREQLWCESIEDAVESWAGDIEGPLPEEVTVYGFARRELPSAEKLAEVILEHLYNFVAENDYADPDDDSDTPTGGIEEAALRFANTFRNEYSVWACEQVTSKAVKVADYYTETP